MYPVYSEDKKRNMFICYEIVDLVFVVTRVSSGKKTKFLLIVFLYWVSQKKVYKVKQL